MRKDSALCGIARSRFLSSNLIEYLREFESICKTVLAHESGDPGVQFNEKTVGRKSRETVPLSKYIKWYILAAPSRSQLYILIIGNIMILDLVLREPEPHLVGGAFFVMRCGSSSDNSGFVLYV
jgi:hypothetical protein